MMEETIAFSYALLPLINSAAFLPQAFKLYKSTPEEARSISLEAWGIWLLASIITFLYGVINLHDPLFCLVASVSVFWNITLITLVVWKRVLDTRIRQEAYRPLPSIIARLTSR